MSCVAPRSLSVLFFATRTAATSVLSERAQSYRSPEPRAERFTLARAIPPSCGGREPEHAGGCGPAAGGCGPAAGGCGPAAGGCGPAAGGCGPAAGGCGPAAGGCGPAAADEGSTYRLQVCGAALLLAANLSGSMLAAPPWASAGACACFVIRATEEWVQSGVHFKTRTAPEHECRTLRELGPSDSSESVYGEKLARRGRMVLAIVRLLAWMGPGKMAAPRHRRWKPESVNLPGGGLCAGGGEEI
ncbi:protein FAM71B-like [Astatotilapia calliptera]|uniref:protein FAM71B-like n=1 Tax=Astatotilapia calliptera TaxID=8154 RepID=UPI000E42B8D9|nr:protein FAM71B-like [Astatotilapia calliptera]